MKRRYYYYHCTKGCKEIYAVHKVHAAFADLLKGIVAKREVMDLYQEILKAFFSRTNEQRLEKIQKVQSEINKNKARIDKAMQMMLEGEIESFDFKAIKSKLEYMEDNPGEDVALLTADNGMKFRANDCGIKPIMLDEKYSLDVESEEQKEVRKLREENTRLKASMPKLSVEFENGTRVTPFQIEEPDFEEYVKEELRKVRYQYPKESLQINFSSVFGKTCTPNRCHDIQFAA